MTFSATDAAFEGFRIVRRHPLAVVFWALTYVLAFAVFFAAFGGSLAYLMAAAERLQGQQPGPDEVAALLPTYLAFIAVVLPLSLLFNAVLTAAVARAVLRPGQNKLGYLQLGGDELRVLAVSVILFFVFAGVWFAVVVVASLGVALGSLVNTGLAVLLGVLLGIAGAAALVWLAIRLCLAVPVTIAERRIAPFASFALTRGRVLSLLGMTVIAFVMALLVNLLGTIIALPVTMATGGLERLATFDGQTTMQIVQTAGAGLAAWAVVNSVFSALQMAVTQAPFSAAYRDLKGLPHD